MIQSHPCYHYTISQRQIRITLFASIVKRTRASSKHKLAEGEGFEPPFRNNRKLIFETSAFSRSATPPKNLAPLGMEFEVVKLTRQKQSKLCHYNHLNLESKSLYYQVTLFALQINSLRSCGSFLPGDASTPLETSTA